MDYNRRGGWGYGRNRQFAENPSSADGSGPRFAVLRKHGQSLVARFESHEDAMAERARLQDGMGDEFIIRKLW